MFHLIEPEKDRDNDWAGLEMLKRYKQSVNSADHLLRIISMLDEDLLRGNTDIQCVKILTQQSGDD